MDNIICKQSDSIKNYFILRDLLKKVHGIDTRNPIIDLGSIGWKYWENDLKIDNDVDGERFKLVIQSAELISKNDLYSVFFDWNDSEYLVLMNINEITTEEI